MAMGHIEIRDAVVEQNWISDWIYVRAKVFVTILRAVEIRR
ncbi:hypothetical protein [Nocardia sp. NPDC004604]